MGTPARRDKNANTYRFPYKYRFPYTILKIQKVNKNLLPSPLIIEAIKPKLPTDKTLKLNTHY